jgi:hypothetical protein
MVRPLLVRGVCLIGAGDAYAFVVGRSAGLLTARRVIERETR